ncbi:MAG: class I SAM-dependent methyltransferase [Cytophagaceae bacterium]|jgi:23S rRNA (cytosine1962-C5)-methyltransferase|nr:class I SAM-dependent methyltransferase [Cytophagaceae bacterium]
MQLLTPQNFTDYELIDSGNYMKLERFGTVVLSRPEPQAVWNTSLNENEWKKLLHAEFKKNPDNPEKGKWIEHKKIPSQWQVQYPLGDQSITLKLAMTSFKHVGIFPEQAPNWNFIYDTIKSRKSGSKVLNLFAYTGGASLAARAAGAEVTHLDAVKQVVTWSKENMELSHLSNIRWMVEDALKFVLREVRRGHKYDGILLDPPAYGRGPEGEKWVIDEHLLPILEACKSLLKDDSHFLLLNLYSIGFSPLIIETLLTQLLSKENSLQTGELFLQDNYGKKLPLSIFGRSIRS